MTKTILAGALAITAACTLTACENEFTGSGAAINHCKNVAERKLIGFTSPEFRDMKTKDYGGGEWSVTGFVDVVNLDGAAKVLTVTCDVYMDKGMSDGADVRATIDLIRE